MAQRVMTRCIIMPFALFILNTLYIYTYTWVKGFVTNVMSELSGVRPDMSWTVVSHPELSGVRPLCVRRCPEFVLNCRKPSGAVWSLSWVSPETVLSKSFVCPELSGAVLSSSWVTDLSVLYQPPKREICLLNNMAHDTSACEVTLVAFHWAWQKLLTLFRHH